MHEQAWAAGLFDGEGSVSINEQHKPNQRTYRYLRANITQKDRYVLDRFQRAVGVGRVFGPYQLAAPFMYSAQGFEQVQAMISCLWSWLSPVKKQQYISRLPLMNEATHFNPYEEETNA